MDHRGDQRGRVPGRRTDWGGMDRPGSGQDADAGGGLLRAHHVRAILAPAYQRVSAFWVYSPGCQHVRAGERGAAGGAVVRKRLLRRALPVFRGSVGAGERLVGSPRGQRRGIGGNLCGVRGGDFVRAGAPRGVPEDGGAIDPPGDGGVCRLQRALRALTQRDQAWLRAFCSER